MEALLQPLVGPIAGWVESHAAWAGPLVFLICFLESLVIVSALLPATVILIAIGSLATAGLLDLGLLIAWGVAGAGLGFWASYEAGRRWSAWILALRWLAARPQLIQRGHDFFVRWGVAAIFVARFLGPGRVVVPTLAGSLGVRPAVFHTANWLSALLWAPAMLAPAAIGQFLAAELEALPPPLRSAIVVALIAAAILGWRALRGTR